MNNPNNNTNNNTNNNNDYKSFQLDLDDIPLYKNAKNRMVLQMINEYVSLNILKRRLENKNKIRMANENYIYETKKLNRKYTVIDGQLQSRIKKVTIKA